MVLIGLSKAQVVMPAKAGIQAWIPAFAGMTRTLAKREIIQSVNAVRD